jgi:hypothetical protein
VKLFVFQFINSYASFFYLAFIAEYVGECPEAGCMSSLAINVAIIFGSRLATAFISKVILPFFTYRYRLWDAKKKQEESKLQHKEYSRPEQELMLEKV